MTPQAWTCAWTRTDQHSLKPCDAQLLSPWASTPIVNLIKGHTDRQPLRWAEDLKSCSVLQIAVYVHQTPVVLESLLALDADKALLVILHCPLVCHFHGLPARPGIALCLQPRQHAGMHCLCIVFLRHHSHLHRCWRVKETSNGKLYYFLAGNFSLKDARGKQTG